MRLRNAGYIAALLTLIVAIIPHTADAQYRYEFSDSLGHYKVVFRPWSDTPQGARRELSSTVCNIHELRFGIAANDNVYMWDEYWPQEFAPMHIPLSDNNIAYQPSFKWVTLNVDYGYWVRNWLHVGVAASYTGGFTGEFHRYNHQRLSSRNLHIISLLPQLRFAYLNRNVVQLYSSVAIGASFSIGNLNGRVRPGRAMVALDIKLIGISIGRRWFGFAELGYGWRGIFNAGFGCRFGSNR